jgi:AcrR family transcriptional regulator
VRGAMGDTGQGFIRARSPENRERRRQSILDAAEYLLGGAQVADITLRDIGRQAGIATSNVLRYFENREAVFLELLNREYGAWLDALPAELAPTATPVESVDTLVDATLDVCADSPVDVPADLNGDVSADLPVDVPAGPTADAPVGPGADVLVDLDGAGRPTPLRGFAHAYAASLTARPVMCELASVLASVLERTVSVETVRTYKRRALANNDRLADIIRARVPGLDRAAAKELASATNVLIAGLWPLAHPGPTVVAAVEDPALLAAHVDFAARCGRMIELLAASLRDPAAP